LKSKIGVEKYLKTATETEFEFETWSIAQGQSFFSTSFSDSFISLSFILN